ncbi:MAG TPA: multiple monosaccharide ABC transporter substrate-binding protein [Candidatus Limnocylindrales bacterium]|nr:multiple monosaccharide ABC transporter substrate-binding protein [Candidatus Limnocylindrales bacterium]
MKKFLAVALAAGALVVAACGGGAATPAPSTAPASQAATEAPASEAPASEAPAESAAPAAGGLVGIAMPTKSSARWIADGDNLVKALSALGYETDLQYAEDDIPTQVSQVENMITKGAKVLVIAAIDGTTLADTLQKAADAGIKVFAYDRLIRNSPNVDFYAAFDNFDVGVAQAGSIVDSLDLNNAAGPFNLELFAGSPDDNNAGFFFNGAMSILQPFIDSGKLVVQSKEVKFPEQVGTLRWDGAAAQARMDNILATYYADKRVDAVLSPYDGISRGIIASLKQVGYYAADKPGPVVTGQDAELPSVKSILAGEQTSTVFKDTRLLAAQVATMVSQFLAGKEVAVNDTTTYDNGVKVVPSYLLPVLSVTKDNVTQALVDTGYYTADQIAN